MIAEELINYSIPPLKKTDTAQMALLWMEEMRVNQLPVIEANKFKGMISEEMILEGNTLEAKVGDYQLQGENCYLTPEQHLFDFIRLAGEHHTDLVALLDEEGKFNGIVTLDNALQALAQTNMIQSPGGIIVLSMRQIDYSLAHISRLAEENQAKILGLYTQDDPQNPHMLTLTLKLNTKDLQTVKATFERFDYHIIATFEKSTVITSDQERINHLLKYLDI
ncbi:MAG: CBS domain-containing protein [Cytophagales bacterium]|nr:CBS domain-containing protein [Cytophagales bacterium]